MSSELQHDPQLSFHAIEQKCVFLKRCPKEIPSLFEFAKMPKSCLHGCKILAVLKVKCFHLVCLTKLWNRCFTHVQNMPSVATVSYSKRHKQPISLPHSNPGHLEWRDRGRLSKPVRLLEAVLAAKNKSWLLSTYFMYFNLYREIFLPYIDQQWFPSLGTSSRSKKSLFVSFQSRRQAIGGTEEIDRTRQTHYSFKTMFQGRTFRCPGL